MFLTFYKVLFSDSSRTFFINMSNEIEIWKDIPNYEGLYQASNLGRIRSLGNNRFKNPKILKCGIGLTGYKRVMLYGFGKRKE